MTVSGTVGTLKSHPIGALLGGVALYFVAKKALKVEKTWALVGLVAVGVIGGAMAQAQFSSKATLAPAIAKA